MKFFSLSVILLLICYFCVAQQFINDGVAIHKDSLSIKSWVVSATVERGYVNIADTSKQYSENGVSSNKAFFGNVENVVGKANGKFLSLGDGGWVVLEFGKPIVNGPGPDFAVFENAIFVPPSQTEFAFVELAFVEVSSDGVNYERFPAISNQPYEEQISTFDPMDWKLFKNFAGVYPVFYGYPFDLDDIPGVIVDKSNITHVKIIDAVGNIDPKYASYDSQGNIVNDPWPTEFHSCGFDLDAVAVINEGNVNINQITDRSNTLIYPNPATDIIRISAKNLQVVRLFDLFGREIINELASADIHELNISNINSGAYIIVVECKDKKHSKKVIINE